MNKELEAFRNLMERLSNNVTLKEWDLCNKDMQTVENFIEQALKRNEPMKVKNKRFSGVTQVGICDNCSGKVIEVNHNYCPLCGQRLD